MSVATPKKRPRRAGMTGEELRKLRAAAKLTQAEAADRLGVPIGTLRNWEQGYRGISVVAAGFIKSKLASKK